MLTGKKTINSVITKETAVLRSRVFPSPGKRSDPGTRTAQLGDNKHIKERPHPLKKHDFFITDKETETG